MSVYQRAVLACLAGVALSAVLAASSQATISPVTLKLDQSTGTTAGTSPYSLGFDAKFTTTPGDSPKDITTIFPPGLLANADLDGGACLTFTTPNAACQIASGTVTTGGGTAPAAEYLVQPPKAADVAGVMLVITGSPAPNPVADVTLRTSPDVGLNIAFSNLPAVGLSEINLTLTNLRLPSSCPSPPANVSIQADSYNDPSQQSASFPLTVTGCGALPYSPSLAATMTRDSADTGAELVASVTQAANEAASSGIELDAPSSLGYNLGPDTPCVTVAPCKVGTVSASSPLLPAPALANGTVTLGGTLSSPTLTLSWPAPLALSIVGKASLSPAAITFTGVPDLPLTSLTMDITGPSGGKAFTTTCAPSSFTGKFTAQGGQTHTSVAPITFNACPTRPTATGTLSGLRSGHPKLGLTATAGIGAAKLASLSVGLPRGLAFNRAAIVTRKVCTGVGAKKKCTTTIKVKGLSIKGAKAKAVRLKHGRLLITFKKATTKVSLVARGPLLLESKGLRSKVRKHETKSLKVNVKVTDVKHAATSISLKLKAK